MLNVYVDPLTAKRRSFQDGGVKKAGSRRNGADSAQIRVNATFTVSGVIVVSADYTATQLQTDIAADLGVAVENVVIEENVAVGATARTRNGRRRRLGGGGGARDAP